MTTISEAKSISKELKFMSGEVGFLDGRLSVMDGGAVFANGWRAFVDGGLASMNRAAAPMNGMPPATGGRGEMGDLGEVTNEVLASAIAGVTGDSSANSNGVDLLNLTVSDPPTQAEMQMIARKLDELITSLRR